MLSTRSRQSVAGGGEEDLVDEAKGEPRRLPISSQIMRRPVAVAVACMLSLAACLCWRGGGTVLRDARRGDTLAPDDVFGVRMARPTERVLVTGGLGFIGSHVVDLLLDRGFEVVVLDDESNGHNHNARASEAYVPRDITVVRELPPSGLGVSHVVHLAAAISVAESMKQPAKYERVNVNGTRNVLEWARAHHVKRVVAASSAAIYGNPAPSLLPLKEEAGYAGVSPYAETKFRLEGLLEEQVKLAEEADPPLSATAFRFFNVYGPRQDPRNPYSGVISLFMEAASSAEPIKLLGDGLQTRDFVYVKDVARAVVTALLLSSVELPGFSVFNVCTGKSITVLELSSLVKDALQSSSPVLHLDPREGDIRESACNPSKLTQTIGFSARYSVKQGLLATARWFTATARSE